MMLPYSKELAADADAVGRGMLVMANGGYMAPRLIDYWMARGGPMVFAAWRLFLSMKVRS